MLCVSCSRRQLPTSQAAPYQWTEARESTALLGSSRVILVYNDNPLHLVYICLSDHEGFPGELHSEVALPPKGEATEPGPSEFLFKALAELYKSKL